MNPPHTGRKSAENSRRLKNMGKIAYFENCLKVTPGPNSIILGAQRSFLMFPEQ